MKDGRVNYARIHYPKKEKKRELNQVRAIGNKKAQKTRASKRKGWTLRSVQESEPASTFEHPGEERGSQN